MLVGVAVGVIVGVDVLVGVIVGVGVAVGAGVAVGTSVRPGIAVLEETTVECAWDKVDAGAQAAMSNAKRAIVRKVCFILRKRWAIKG